MRAVTVAELLQKASEQDWPTSAEDVLVKQRSVEPQNALPQVDPLDHDEPVDPPPVLVRSYMRVRWEGTL